MLYLDPEDLKQSKSDAKKRKKKRVILPSERAYWVHQSPPCPDESDFWPTVLNREHMGYQKSDPGGDHYYGWQPHFSCKSKVPDSCERWINPWIHGLYSEVLATVLQPKLHPSFVCYNIHLTTHQSHLPRLFFNVTLMPCSLFKQSLICNSGCKLCKWHLACENQWPLSRRYPHLSIHQIE